MICTSQDGFTRQAPVVCAVESTEPRTLQRLIDYYQYQPVTPKTAQQAINERLAIIHECDAKGYRTVEDTEMMDYLWNIRNLVVGVILEHQRKEQQQRRAGS